MLLLTLITLCVPAWAEEPKVCGAPVALKDGWTLAAQAEVGLDAAKLCELDSFIAQWPEANIHAVVVVRNGKLAMERYFAGEDERWGDKLGRVTYGPEVKHDLRSISKSVTSLLVGIARSAGKFPALDSSVFDAFPDYADLRTPEKVRITFHDLLTMSSGLAWDENRPWTDPRNNEAGMILAADPFRYILSRRSPGRRARPTPIRAAARRCSAKRWCDPPARACATMRATNCSRRSISPTSNGWTPASATSWAPSAACGFARAMPPSSAV
jgi:CubicO group peptidase (beta-lactamase class C family)